MNDVSLSVRRKGDVGPAYHFFLAAHSVDGSSPHTTIRPFSVTLRFEPMELPSCHLFTRAFSAETAGRSLDSFPGSLRPVQSPLLVISTISRFRPTRIYVGLTVKEKRLNLGSTLSAVQACA